MPNSKEVYQLILSEKSGQSLAIFDLDSTLYNVSYRTQKIILNFSNEEKIIDLYPREANAIKSIRVGSTDWGMKEAFARTEFTASNEFYRDLKEYWKKHFFSSSLLTEDIPYPGAVDYVNALYNNQIQIMYLTGRDDQNMRDGTIISLRKWGFPTYNIENSLFMKPKKGNIEDEDFKTNKLKEIIPGRNNVWFFENEPVILNKVISDLPQIKIVWLDTTHSRKGTPPKSAYVIKDYLRP